MAIGTTQGNAIIDAMLGGGGYISLHSADPGSTGANELAASNHYARQQADWDEASGKATANSDAELFSASGGDWATATHFAVWSAVTSGTFHFGGALSVSKTIADGETGDIAIGALTFTLT